MFVNKVLPWFFCQSSFSYVIRNVLTMTSTVLARSRSRSKQFNTPTTALSTEVRYYTVLINVFSQSTVITATILAASHC